MSPLAETSDDLTEEEIAAAEIAAAEEAEAAAAETDRVEEDPEDIARAKRLGYVSEADWDEERAEREGRRKPEKFLTAKEFIEKTESSLPMMRQQLRTIDKKLDEATAQNKDMHAILQEQRRMTREAIARARKEERDKAVQAMDEAVETADTSGYKAAQQKVKELDEAERTETTTERQEPVTEPGKAPPDPAIEAWKAQNPWFNVDEEITPYMISQFGKVTRDPSMASKTQAEKLAAAKRLVMARFPEKFSTGNPRREGHSSVNTPSGARVAGNSVDRRFSSLPEADRAAYEKQRKMFEARGSKFTRAEFLADYGND